jgi:hypothetical protein
MASFVLIFFAVTPLKRHRVGGPEIVQFIGLVILIAMIYKCFGADALVPLKPSAITIFAIGVCLLIWPMFLRERE